MIVVPWPKFITWPHGLVVVCHLLQLQQLQLNDNYPGQKEMERRKVHQANALEC